MYTQNPFLTLLCYTYPKLAVKNTSIWGCWSDALPLKAGLSLCQLGSWSDKYIHHPQKSLSLFEGANKELPNSRSLITRTTHCKKQILVFAHPKNLVDGSSAWDYQATPRQR